jgi:hypothetical protein
MTESTAPAPRGAGFVAAVVVGWATIGFAAAGLVQAKIGPVGALEVAAWVLAGNVAHDVLIAPLVCVIGIGLAQAVPEPGRTPVRSGLVASALVVAVAYPALRGFGRRADNPSILPLDYGTAVLTVLGVIWGLVAVWIAARVLEVPRGADDQ